MGKRHHRRSHHNPAAAYAGYGADAPAAPSPAAAGPAAAVLTQAAVASQGDHPAVPAALTRAAAAASGQPAPVPPPVGPQDAAALNQAASASKELGDHPIVTAALASAAQEASANGAKAAQVLTQAAQVASVSNDHPAVKDALTNGAAKAMGAPPPAAAPKGPDAALALANATNVSASKGDHPAVTATLADAAAKASQPVVAKVLAEAAAGPDMAIHPDAARALATAAVANNPPPPGVLPTYANLPGAPQPPPIPGAPPAVPPAAYVAGAPASPPAAPPPPPPAIASAPPAQAAAIEASTLATLKPKDDVALQSGETLESGHYIPGHNRGRHGGPRHKLVMQHDGNLVLYDGMTPTWASHTGGTGARRARMRPDGNFVLENDRGQVIWASGARSPGSFVVLQDDGNFVQYCGERALWASHQDARSKGRDLRRIGNVFLGGARHFGRGRGTSFGAEVVRDPRTFHKLAQHMRNAIDERHRVGLDLAITTSSGIYSPEEVQFALARLSPDDRAGFAAGTALKIGLTHPSFGEHIRSRFHGDFGCEDGFGDDDMGLDWRFWRWFGGRRNEVAMFPLPPPEVLPIAGPAAAPPPPPDTSANAPPPPPPQGMVDPESPESALTDTITTTDITAPLILPDGSSMPVPYFRDWNARRAWEAEQRRILGPRFPGMRWGVRPPPPRPGFGPMRRFGVRERMPFAPPPPVIASPIGTPIVRAPVSPFAPPPPPGVPSTPIEIERRMEPTHSYSPEHAFEAPPEMVAPHEVPMAPPMSAPTRVRMHGEMGSEYTMSEHMQMYPAHDFGVDGNFQFGVDGNFQFGVDGAEMGLEQAALDSMEGAALGNQYRAFRGSTGFGLEDAALDSLQGGDFNQGYSAFPNQTGFGLDPAQVAQRDRRWAHELADARHERATEQRDARWAHELSGARHERATEQRDARWARELAAKRHELATEQRDARWARELAAKRRARADMGWEWPWRRRLALAQQQQGVVAPQPYGPTRFDRRDRRYFAGADPVSSATDAAALQAAGAATAIGTTALGKDSQKMALSVLKSHPHLRLGWLSTGIGTLWHKAIGLLDYVIHPTISKATIAPDGKGGLVTTLPTVTVSGKAG